MTCNKGVQIRPARRVEHADTVIAGTVAEARDLAWAKVFELGRQMKDMGLADRFGYYPKNKGRGCWWIMRVDRSIPEDADAPTT